MNELHKSISKKEEAPKNLWRQVPQIYKYRRKNTFMRIRGSPNSQICMDLVVHLKPDGTAFQRVDQLTSLNENVFFPKKKYLKPLHYRHHSGTFHQPRCACPILYSLKDSDSATCKSYPRWQISPRHCSLHWLRNIGTHLPTKCTSTENHQEPAVQKISPCLWGWKKSVLYKDLPAVYLLGICRITGVLLLWYLVDQFPSGHFCECWVNLLFSNLVQYESCTDDINQWLWYVWWHHGPGQVVPFIPVFRALRSLARGFSSRSAVLFPYCWCCHANT